MRDYQPISLAALCNVGTEVIGADATPNVGTQTFHGLPFEIAEGTTCFLGFGEGVNTNPIQVSVNENPKRVIFVHRLLESRIPEGEPIAKLIANYVFHYTDGETISVPIRERFEIGGVPQGWGQQTFLAIPDRKGKFGIAARGTLGVGGQPTNGGEPRNAARLLFVDVEESEGRR